MAPLRPPPTQPPSALGPPPFELEAGPADPPSSEWHLAPGPNVGPIRRDVDRRARKSEREIALALNQRGILSDLDRPWTRASIHQILTNEKYIGNNIFNRVSYKLKQRRVVNRPDTWVRADSVFPSIVDRALFERARAIY
jgi:hypothetical protein